MEKIKVPEVSAESYLPAWMDARGGRKMELKMLRLWDVCSTLQGFQSVSPISLPRLAPNI